MTLSAAVLETPDPRALAAFYRTLLGWPVVEDGPTWVMLRPEVGAGLSFQQAYAVESGATVAEFQPQDGVRVCLDPDGHPFCLYMP
jgi:hypothetical protein